MTTDWMSPAGPDDAWHGDDRADDGGRLDPDTGLPIPAETLDPPADLTELQASLHAAIDRLVAWAEDENEPFDLGKCLDLIAEVARARAAHRQAQEAARQ